MTASSVDVTNPMGCSGIAEGASRLLYLFEVKLSYLHTYPYSTYKDFYLVSGLGCAGHFHF
jgi:hypothetical protein